MTHVEEADSMLTTVLEAVAAACRVTRRVQRHLGDIRQHTKDDRSPVTVADYASQAIIAAHLERAWGHPALVGEEDASTLRSASGAALRAEVLAATREAWPEATEADVMEAIDLGNHDASMARYWTLDPIDGTKGFLRGGQYAVSLALIEDGKVVLGVLGCPNLSADFERPFDDPDPVGCLFFADRTGPSRTTAADDPGGQASEIAVDRSTDTATMRICESVESGHSRLDDTARVGAHLGARGKPARLDSQCKYAVVARGQADVYLRLPTRADYVERIWDHAAGMIIAEQAGATVTDVSGRPLDFGQGMGLENNRGILCAAPGFHHAVRGAIEDLDLARK